MLLKSLKQPGGEAEVAFFEIFGILGTVDSGEVEHEVGLTTVAVELSGCRVEVIFKHLIDLDRIVTGFPVPDIIELCAKISADKPLGAGYKYFHIN